MGKRIHIWHTYGVLLHSSRRIVFVAPHSDARSSDGNSKYAIIKSKTSSYSISGEVSPPLQLLTKSFLPWLSTYDRCDVSLYFLWVALGSRKMNETEDGGPITSTLFPIYPQTLTSYSWKSYGVLTTIKTQQHVRKDHSAWRLDLQFVGLESLFTMAVVSLHLRCCFVMFIWK